MKPLIFFLILLLSSLPVSAVEIGEGTCFNFTDISITTNDTHVFDSISVHPHHIEMGAIDVFGVNTTNYTIITHWLWGDIITFNTSCVNADIWFNCTNAVWHDNSIGMYKNNTLIDTTISDGGTISYQFVAVDGDNYFRFETYSVEDVSTFGGLVVVIGDVCDVFSPIVDLIIAVGTIMIALAMIGFIMALLLGLFKVFIRG